MSITKVATFAAIGFLSLPGMALASSFAIATHNVNVRAGPDTGYPVVDVARAGDQIYVFGCLEYRSWCDVDYDGLRGWINSNYLAFYDRGRRYVGPDAMYRMSAPIVTFSFGGYWDRHYRGRPFYRERNRWEHYHRGRPGPRPRPDRPHPVPEPQELSPGAPQPWRSGSRRLIQTGPEPYEIAPVAPEPQPREGRRGQRRMILEMAPDQPHYPEEPYDPNWPQ
jgi:uncharacterized protein YraI